MKFDNLISTIHTTHSRFQQSAVKAINLHVTIRNWLIGLYIVEFELIGKDRSVYGENLLQKLSDNFTEGGLSYRNLRLYRQFYLEYPHLAETVPDQLKKLNILEEEIWQSPIAKFKSNNTDLMVPAEKLITKLSFTHLIELFAVKYPFKKTFNEPGASKETGVCVN